MKTIILYIEQPKEERQLIEYTIRQADAQKQKVHIVSVVNPHPASVSFHAATVPQAAIYNETEINAILKNRKGDLFAVLEALKKEINMPFEASDEVLSGLPGDILKEKAKSKDVAGIVISGELTDGGWMIGDLAMELIRSVPKPVWVIPPERIYVGYPRILLATDYDNEDLEVLRKLVDIAQHDNGEILALHVSDGKNEFQEKIKQVGFNQLISEKIDYNRISFIAVSREKNEKTASIISEQARKNDVNLIVVLKENKGLIERIFNSSETKKIIEQTDIPVIVYHK